MTNISASTLARDVMMRIKTCKLASLPAAIFLALLILHGGKAAAQRTDWATLLGAQGNEIGYAVATDYDGSVVVVGSFEGATNIGGAPLSSAGNTDVFIAKFSRTGALLWAKRVGGKSSDYPVQVSVDRETGDAVVAGSFSVAATVDDQVLQGEGASDVFIVRFSSSGTLQWALAFGSAEDDVAAGVAVAPSGETFLTGHFSGRFMCGQTALTSAGGVDSFVARISLGGALEWCRRIGGSSDDSVRGIAVDDAGLFAVTGTFGSTTDLGGGTVASNGKFDAFVAAYAAADGSYRWARTMGGSGYDEGNAIAFDPAGALVVTGYFGLFGGAANFGSGVVDSHGGADAFVAKYSRDGESMWAGALGGTYDDYANAVSVDPAGNIVAVGEFQGTVQFAGGAVTSAGQFDAFAAGWSSSGVPLWCRSYGDLVNDKAYGVAIDFEGNTFVTGFSIFRIDLGTGPLYSIGSSDAFLAKLAPAVRPPTRTFTRPPQATNTPQPTNTLRPTNTVQPTSTPPPTNTLRPASTPQPTNTLRPTNTPRPTRTPRPTAAPSTCAVDCNADGRVTVNELVVGINIVLGQAAISTCAVFDANDNGVIAINEVVAAVNNALTGCVEPR